MSHYDVLEIACRAARTWLADVETGAVCARDDRQALLGKLHRQLPQQDLAADTVVRDLIEATKNGLLGSAGGRFFAWVIGGSLPSALAADWLTSSWEQNAALYACSPAASVIEEIAGEWIKELLDLPRDASVAFTTGCQLAHFTCLAAARASVLEKSGWNVNEDGLFGAPALTVLTSEQRHGSVDRAVRYLGLGNRSLKSLSTDDSGRILVSSLREALLEASGPKILVLNAADLNIASFDRFDELIAIAHGAGAWVHVDGAFGLFARASKSKKHMTEGLELADSWATDAHKWLNVPFDCGIAIIKDREAHRQAMTISASYIEPESNARDQIDWNPEWSRRARGIPVYAALLELGKEGVEDLIDRTSQHCHTLVTEIAEIPGTQLLWEPHLNQGLVRFLDERENACERDHDIRTKRVIENINEGGDAFFSGTAWKGMYAMRISVVSWRTTDKDVLKTVEAVKAAVAAAASPGVKELSTCAE